MEKICSSCSDSLSDINEVCLPSFEEFKELIEGDAPLRAASCEMNYTVYHKYSDGSAW